MMRMVTLSKGVAMYSVLNVDQDGPVLHFTFVTPGPEDQQWRHATVTEPLRRWLEEQLCPLAGQHGKALTTDDVTATIAELAARESIPVGAVDWLGLALLASQRHKDTAGRLASAEDAPLRDQCRNAHIVAEVLFEIAERSTNAVQRQLHLATSAA